MTRSHNHTTLMYLRCDLTCLQWLLLTDFGPARRDDRQSASQTIISRHQNKQQISQPSSKKPKANTQSRCSLHARSLPNTKRELDNRVCDAQCCDAMGPPVSASTSAFGKPRLKTPQHSATCDRECAIPNNSGPDDIPTRQKRQRFCTSI